MDLGIAATPIRQASAPAASSGIPPGKFAWATVHQFADKEPAKAACIQGPDVYSTSRNGIKWWNAQTGRYGQFG